MASTAMATTTAPNQNVIGLKRKIIMLDMQRAFKAFAYRTLQNNMKSPN